MLANNAGNVDFPVAFHPRWFQIFLYSHYVTTRNLAQAAGKRLPARLRRDFATFAASLPLSARGPSFEL